MHKPKHGAADVVIVATIWWGAGNLPCLDLAAEALQKGKQVYLLAAVAEQDFTGGARERIRKLE